MAAPIANKIILPLDTGNAGKNVRTQTRVIGPDTVHEHFFVPTSPRSTVGRFKVNTGQLTIPAAVHNGTTTGFFWLVNPVGSTVKLAVKRISWNIQFVALAVDLLGGEMRFNRCTFTGVASGATAPPAKTDSVLAAAVGSVRLASTGLTVLLDGAMYGTQYPTMDLATGGAGHWNPYVFEWSPSAEDDELILRAGEGLVCWHAIAVTTANRRLFVNLAWDEFE